jgi:hypothetical protein
MRARQGAGGRRQEDYNLIFKPDLALFKIILDLEGIIRKC